MATIETVWELRSYDVVGNKDDGYEVNDTCVIDRAYPLTLQVETMNAGTPQAFDTAAPTEQDALTAFGLDRRVLSVLELDGDDLTVYVSGSHGRPIGEMRCTSHASLSPIRAK